VSTRLDQELKAAFETASEFVQPPAGLAGRARTATRARRRRIAIAIAAATVVVLVVAGGSYVLGAHRRPSPPASHDRPRRLLTLPPYWQIQQLAVAGPYLYVLAGENGEPFNTLGAYDRATGRLIHSVSIPAAPFELTLGPGGLVWLSLDYPDQNGGPTGTWLLSPDLRLRSSDSKVAQSVIVPVSRTTAVTLTQHGLVTVRMPLPGQPGRASQHLQAGTSLGQPFNTAPGVWAGWLDGRVVAQVTNGYGLDSHLVIAGEPGHRFGSAPRHEAGAVAIAGGSLWVQLYAVVDNNAAASGPLVRLDGQLRETTPAFVQDSSVLTRSEGVWSEGSTIWVASAARGHSLVCFAAGSHVASVTTLPVRGQVAALAATPGTVYVTTTPGNSYGNFTVMSYPVPSVCR
jgi:hypothetical protein